MILSGRLMVGEKLPPERELAESMQVSRAVVNSGITELARKGFLIIKPRVGTFVADYRRDGTMDTLMSIMNYNGGILREAEAKDEEIHLLRSYVEALKTAKTTSEAAEFAFRFQHELAFLSGNTLIPLIFTSFKVPVISLWERFCRMYGIEQLYANSDTLCNYCEARDVDKATEWISSSLNESIDGKYTIYY